MTHNLSSILVDTSVTLPASPIWLSRKELAQRWNIPAQTLAQHACEGRGPRYMRIGRHVRYSLADIEAYEAAILINPADKFDGAGG
jgi:hypothetical protein